VIDQTLKTGKMGNGGYHRSILCRRFNGVLVERYQIRYGERRTFVCMAPQLNKYQEQQKIDFGLSFSN
jgi:hypothetical protein